MTDCIIVGGGLIGLLTARELTLAGCKVLVLERGRPGQESSWAGGGILSPLYPWRYPDAISTLVAWSQQTYPQLARELAETTGIDPEWIQSGLLVTDSAETEPATDWAWRHGVGVEILEHDDIQRCEPALGMIPERAVWMPEVAQIRNPSLLRGVYDDLLMRGVTVMHDAGVTGLDVEHGRIRGVVSEKGRFHARYVIITSGAWSAEVLSRIGIRLAVRPVRGQMVMFRASPLLLQRIVLHDGHYLIPRRDGRILAGSTLESTGYDKSTTATARERLVRAATTLVPDLGAFPVERHWAGLRPGSPGGVPFIGKVNEIKGLYVNAGHYRNGVVLAPASSRLLTDILLARDPIVDPDPYRPDREPLSNGMTEIDDSGRKIDFV